MAAFDSVFGRLGDGRGPCIVETGEGYAYAGGLDEGGTLVVRLPLNEAGVEEDVTRERSRPPDLRGGTPDDVAEAAAGPTDTRVHPDRSPGLPADVGALSDIDVDRDRTVGEADPEVLTASDTAPADDAPAARRLADLAEGDAVDLRGVAPRSAATGWKRRSRRRPAGRRPARAHAGGRPGGGRDRDLPRRARRRPPGPRGGGVECNVGASAWSYPVSRARARFVPGRPTRRPHGHRARSAHSGRGTSTRRWTDAPAATESEPARPNTPRPRP